MSDTAPDPGPVPDEPTLPPGLAAVIEMYDDAVVKIAEARLCDEAFDAHCRMTFMAMTRLGHCAPECLPARVRVIAENLMLAVWKTLGGEDRRFAFSALTTIQLAARLVAAVYEEEQHALTIDPNNPRSTHP